MLTHCALQNKKIGSLITAITLFPYLVRDYFLLKQKRFTVISTWSRRRFSSCNFPFWSSNIFLPPAYGVSVSQVVRYAIACFKFQDVLIEKTTFLNYYITSAYDSASCFIVFYYLK